MKYHVVETNGTCASTGNPSIFRTLSRHRTIRGAVRAWKACPFRSHKIVIVDEDGRLVHWNSNGDDIWVEAAPAAFGE